jgi:peptidoglycan/LPS O-acetylase OafA/YrhL
VSCFILNDRAVFADIRSWAIMGIYSVWPYFICMALIFLVTSTPAFKMADTPPNPGTNRISTLDGLRGILALAVFFMHAMIYFNLLAHGQYGLPPSRFYTQLGQSGVAVFFMITGYLFWSRVLNSDGRIDIYSLYIGRLFRIGPLYLFALAAMLLIVFANTGPHLNVSLPQLAKELGVWSALGILSVGPLIDGFIKTRLILLEVTWTLRYEWLFYFSLPLTAFLARCPPLHLPIVFSLLTLFLIVNAVLGNSLVGFQHIDVISLFLSGMLCASLEKKGLNLKISDSVSSFVIASILALDFIKLPGAYNSVSIFLLLIFFYLVVSGSSFFGLLKQRTARRLGDVSFGICGGPRSLDRNWPELR